MSFLKTPKGKLVIFVALVVGLAVVSRSFKMHDNSKSIDNENDFHFQRVWS